MHYIRKVMGVDIPGDSLSLSEVAAIKKSGGLNNDWDLTDAILNSYLCSAFQDVDAHMKGRLVKAARAGDDRAVLDEMIRIQQGNDGSRLENLVRERRAPQLFARMDGVKRKSSPFVMNRGDVLSGNLTKRIFQELYLGSDLFQQIYGEKPLFYRNGGYIEQERLIPTISQLDELFGRFTLSIATGRPAVEARYALDQFSIQRYFKTVVSEDNIVEAERRCRESLRKPHPYSLSLCMEQSSYTAHDCVYYIGDMPDDIVAAGRAEIRSIGFVNRDTDESAEEKGEHRELLMSHGACGVYSDFEEIISYFKEQ
jgi:phosphoglycolate phosphatase-like HAD superfamily hydrolase